MKKTIILLVSLISSYTTYSQCGLLATSSVDSILCGDTALIVAGFNGSAFDCGFNDTINPLCPGWATTTSAQINANPCGNIPTPLPGYFNQPANNSYLWMGNLGTVPRVITTDTLNLTFNDSICFDMIYAVQGGCSNAEGPDLVHEGVSVQYSIDGGLTWIDIIYFSPDGQTFVSNPGAGYTPFTNVTSAGTPMTVWNRNCIPTPTAAQTNNVLVRWIQIANSSINNDHWGLDNIYFPTILPIGNIYSTITDSLLFDPNDTTNTTTMYELNASPFSDTIYSFYSIDTLGDTCFATVPLFVATTSAGPDIVLDCNNNIVQLQGTGVSLNAGFSWWPITALSNPNIFNPTASPLDTINYIFSSNCGTDTMTVNVISNYSFSTSGDTVICVGDTAYLEVFGGAQSYAWSPNDGSISDTTIANPMFTPTTTTTYIVVSDSVGCIKTDTMTIYVSNKNFVFMLTPVSAGCSGGNAGSFFSVATGAIGPFTYSLFDGVNTTTQLNGLFNNLYAGTYTLTYSDSLGCPVDTTVIVPGGLTVGIDSVSSVNPLCVGANNGSLEVFIDTNTVVSYSINGGVGQVSPIFNNLTDGIYVVEVLNGSCASYDTVVLSAPATVNISIIDSTDLTCAGANNGVIQVAATNGVMPYQFSSDNITFAANGGVLSSLAAGLHTIYVMDDNGCKDSLTASVTEPLAMIISNISITDIMCFGDTNGAISFDVINGTAPFTYSIDSVNFVNSNVFNNLMAGTYFLQVLDSTGCPSSIIEDSISTPSLLNLVEDSTQSSTCGASDGIVYVSASGGASNYIYSINGGTGQNFGTFTGMTAGLHNVTVTDANLCSQTIVVSVVDNGAPTLTITIADSVSCFGSTNATVQLSATGGMQPYQFSINSGTLVNDSLFTNVSGGLQNFIVQDVLGCQGSVDTIIYEPTALVLTATQDSASCFGTNDGNINLSVTGGTSSYLYAVDDILVTQSSAIFAGYSAGTYMTYVVDANSCIDSIMQTVLQADSILINSIVVDSVNCNAAADGQIVFNATGGIAPFTYSINGGTTYASSNTFVTDTGVFNLIVQDASGCTSDVYSAIVYEPTALILDSITTVKANCGLSNGMLEVLASGSVGPYTYSLNSTTVQTSGVFNNLASGIYVISVIDANNCTESINVYVGLNSNILLSVLTFDSVSCNGLADATVTLQASGGILPYSFTLNGGASQSSNVFTNINGGSNVFTMTDSLATCTLTVSQNIFEPTIIGLTTTQDSTSCDEYSNGEIHVTATGGLMPYSYAINNILATQTSADFLGLAASNNMVYMIDYNGCTDSVMQQVYQPDTLEIVNTNAIDISCSADGSITVNAAGGTMPYSYSINGGVTQTSNVFTITTGGTYNLSLFDANGCPTAMAVDSVIAPAPVTFVIDSLIANTSCNGMNDAYISILANGGTGPYTYSFDNGVTYGNTNDMLVSAGTYTIIVQDIFSCQSASTTVVINEPVALNSTANTNTISCFGLSDGNIVVNTVTGGTPPYFVNIGGTDVAYVPNLLFDNLAAGNYTVTVTDDNSCSMNYVVTVDDVADINLNLESLTDVSCNGAADGEISVSATGGTPMYTFSLTSSTGIVSLSDNNSVVFNNLIGSEIGITYPIVVTDLNGCQKSFTQTIIQPNQLIIDSLVPSPLSCFGYNDAMIAVFASGGSSPYTYLWSPTGYQSSNADGLSPGVHTVTVTDANGCSVSASETINAVDPIIATISPDSANITMGDTVNLNVTTLNAIGTNLQYSWTPTTGLSCTDCQNPLATVYNDISYSVIVTDENGCQSYNYTEMYITVNPSLFFFIPNGFTPNGDGVNDDFIIYGQNIKTVEMMIFNRWGEKIFEANTPFESWDGTFKGVEQSTGIYSYVLDVTFLNDAKEHKKGSLSLIR